MKVGIQGYRGSYHHKAAEAIYSESYELVPCRTFRELCHTLHKGEIDGAVLAIENSIAGTILPNYSYILQYDFSVIADVYMPIEHCLLTRDRYVSLSELTEIHSHPMALLQCEDFFAPHTHLRLIETEDTALSAQHLSESKDPHIGVIASEWAGELYGLHTVAKAIQTIKNNFTRFMILTREKPNTFSKDISKTSLMISLNNRPAVLHDALAILKKYGLDMSKIQSIPQPDKPGQYAFIIDIVVDNEAKYLEAMEELKLFSASYKELGRYKSIQLND